MDSHKEGTIRFALGFIKDFIDENTEPLSGDDPYAMEENEHRQQVTSMMALLSEGIIQVLKENWSLRNKMTLIENAMKTPI